MLFRSNNGTYWTSATKYPVCFLVTIKGRIPGEEPIFTSVLVDWNVCGVGESVKFVYDTMLCGNGILTVSKDDDLLMHFSVNPSDSGEEHLIVRVDGYI